MKCPGCGAQIGSVSICPKCDYIVDDSFLKEAPAPGRASVEDRTNPGTQLPKPPPGRAPTPARAERASPERASPEPRPRPARAEPAPDVEPHPNPVASRQTTYSPVFRPEEVEQEAREFLQNLTKADRLTLIGAAATIACSFFPWQDTAANGELIALQTLGVVATCTSAICAFSLFVRLRRLLPDVNPAMPWLVQLASAALTLLWCLVFIRLVSDPTKAPSADGNLMVATSKAAIGAYLGLLGSVVSLAGTLMGLRESSA